MEQLLTMELKEFSDGEMTIALSSVTTDKDVSVNAFIPFSLVSVNYNTNLNQFTNEIYRDLF